MLEILIEQLDRGQALASEQITHAVNVLTQETISVEAKANFLTALARKGETFEEIAAFANELRLRAVQPPLDAETRAGGILDVCGTGGDHVGTFNISTTVAIICAAAGVTVAKHGNRAITSKSGSADVLEALGIKIDLTPEQAARSLRERKFAFFFAPHYHPAFKHIAPARKLCAERGQRSLFNFLGPLLNPARPTAQLMGLPRAELCEPIAQVLQSLGVRRGMVVCGNAGGAQLDELSTLGPNRIAEFYQERGFAASTLALDQFPLQPVTVEDLRGGDREVNAEIIRRILQGQDRGPKRDAVLLNTGAALFVAGHVRSIAEGWEVAGQLIDQSKAAAKLRELALQ
ncbi:MAG TPA: anthranilate phosphoribosyltransferase [Verrucomicrobiae bacterium]|nr:anthranilate phosphoribosyltransferase [Verrucomicrobiae bacterium]